LTTAEKIVRYGMLSLPVESELGRCTMPVREILSLAPGSVIRLPRPVGSKIDLYVGGAPFASGEMIRAGGWMSVRITLSEKKNKE
jgi:flagellar motor switch protein FliN/FliY